jgi:hypothetical protein
MARPNKAALILNQHPWALSIAKRRAEEIGARAPYETATTRGFEVEIPNASDVYAWMLDELGRQEAELGMEAQCWQDKKTKKQMTEWLDNIKQIVENINDVILVVNMMHAAGIKLPKTLPWNEGGSADIDMDAIVAQVAAELAEASPEAETTESTDSED